SSLDQRLPAALSRVNRFNVPYVATIVQAMLASVVTILIFMVYPYATSARASDLSSRVYLVLQGSVAVIWCLSMLFLFADIVCIMRKLPGEFAARRIAHPAVFWVSATIGA